MRIADLGDVPIPFAYRTLCCPVENAALLICKMSMERQVLLKCGFENVDDNLASWTGIPLWTPWCEQCHKNVWISVNQLTFSYSELLWELRGSWLMG